MCCSWTLVSTLDPAKGNNHRVLISRSEPVVVEMTVLAEAGHLQFNHEQVTTLFSRLRLLRVKMDAPGYKKVEAK